MNETVFHIVTIGFALGLGVVALVIMLKLREMRMLVESEDFAKPVTRPVQPTHSKEQPAAAANTDATGFDFTTLSPIESTLEFDWKKDSDLRGDRSVKKRESAPTT